MSQVLYRKYRSGKFAELVGQEQIVKLLRQTVLEGAPAHAYLYTGPRGTGKTSTARIFAKALNCLHSGEKKFAGDACGVCEMCKLAESGRLLDLIEIDAASNRGINEIRDLKEKIAFSPVQGKYKIYIIDEVHMLTKEAFNALLKTLEEPPAHTVLILATTEVHKLPQTILSRVVRFDFRLGTKENLSEKLSRIVAAEGYEIEKSALDRLVRLGKGSYRDAESLLEKLLKSTDGKKITLDSLGEVLGLVVDDELDRLLAAILSESSTQGLLAIVAGVESKGVSPQQFLLDLAERVLDQIEKGSEGAGNYSLRELLRVSGTVQTLISEMNYYPDPYVAIKLRLLELVQSGKPTDEPALKPITEKSSVPSGQSVQVMQITQLKQPTVSKTAVVQPMVDQQAASQAASGLDITAKLVAQVRSADTRIAAMLSQGRVMQNQSLVEVLMPYKFHLDRLAQIKSKQILLSALSQLGVSDVEFSFMLSQNPDQLSVSANTAIKQTDSNNEKLVEEIFSDII